MSKQMIIINDSIYLKPIYIMVCKQMIIIK